MYQYSPSERNLAIWDNLDLQSSITKITVFKHFVWWSFRLKNGPSILRKLEKCGLFLWISKKIEKNNLEPAFRSIKEKIDLFACLHNRSVEIKILWAIHVGNMHANFQVSTLAPLVWEENEVTYGRTDVTPLFAQSLYFAWEGLCFASKAADPFAQQSGVGR